jgi:hypothetical protein
MPAWRQGQAASDRHVQRLEHLLTIAATNDSVQDAALAVCSTLAP